MDHGKPSREAISRMVWRSSCAAALASLVALTPAISLAAGAGRQQTRASLLGNQDAQSDKKAGDSGAKPGIAIPPGTILPVRLNVSLSSTKTRVGQVITGRIMQDVPLAGGAKIPKGSKVLGQIAGVAAATTTSRAEISFRFDRLVARHQVSPITTNLRAIAGFMEVEAAQIPSGLSSGEGEVYVWLPTTQIGGDNVFGLGGMVTRWNNSSEVVGKSTQDGVVGRISVRQGTGCRGPLYGNDRPQALWVFSSDACGVYGLAHLAIANAGRAKPAGLIVLSSNNGNVKIPAGAGMLLRVDETEL